jgi:carboxyvinyl-carboxyphosphonate phosphorylmutase
MTPTEQLQRLRAILAGTKCLTPASVYDALSARIAQSVGYELGMLAGSVSANTVLAAPDLIVITLTEFADQVRRIMRYNTLSLMTDADHGYGNALSVMRTVEELENAGVSGMSIEDTVLPTPFGATKESLISLEEGVGKMKAAVAARRDPSTVIAGRSSALKVEGLEGAIARFKAYEAVGVDALFIIGLEKLEQLQAIRAATKLPLIVGTAPAGITRDQLAATGARILLQGHQPIAAVAKALQDVYTHLYGGGAPADLKGKIASNEEMETFTNGAQYKQWQKDFLR